MKKSIRIISLMLCLILVFSFGCKNKEEVQNNGVFTDGVHIFNVSETDYYLVQEGKTEYKVVIAEEAGKRIVTAKEELQLFFEEATGIKLDVITDANVDYNASAKYIVLGSKKLMDQAGVKTEWEVLNRNGYVIKTVGQSIFVCGAHDEGTLFGVYGLLNQLFEYDCFSNTAYHILRGLKDVKLMNYDITNAPDIELRNSGFTMVTKNGNTVYRMGYTPRDSSLFVHEATSHTLFLILPPDKYNVAKITNDAGEEIDNPDYHPAWYSTCGNHWCFTARGSAKELELMYQTVFEVAKNSFMTNLEGSIFLIGVEDVNTNCTCMECSKNIAKYGTPAASYLMFSNEIAKRIDEWMATEEGKPYAREFLVKITAYQKHEAAPARLNADGDYEPIDGLVAHKNVTVEFSPAAIDFQVSINDEQHEIYRETMLGWQAVCNNISGFSYTINFYYHFVPYDLFNSKQDHYQWLAAANTTWLYDEGDSRNTDALTGWNTLKVYLISKLGWDVNSDCDALTDKFFDQYFQEASESMRKFYNSYRVHSKNMIDNGGMNVALSINFTSLQAKFWPRGMLELWTGYIDEALESISDIKYYDIDRYNQLYDRITLERISVYYMLIEMHSDIYSPDKVLQMKLAVKEDCQRLNVTYAPPDVNALWDAWGV